MRYTKAALLLFGLGLLLGFVVVVIGGMPRLERLASALMAAGLVLLPPALFADGHGFAFLHRLAARLRRGKPSKVRPRSRRPPARRKPAARGPSPPPRRRRN